MRAYLRLLGYLRPYRGRLAAALACMVVYAAMSAISLGLIAPFMKVLFERGGAQAAAPATMIVVPGVPAAEAPNGDRLVGWPEPLRRWAQGAFLDARPLVALERICVFILVVLLLKNLADYLQAF